MVARVHLLGEAESLAHRRSLVLWCRQRLVEAGSAEGRGEEARGGIAYSSIDIPKMVISKTPHFPACFSFYLKKAEMARSPCN